MITVKGKADADWAIISHIIDPSALNVEFKNITFDCKTIKDASGHIFVRQKAGEWIPVSERLPEKDGRYLVCMSWNYHDMDVFMWADGWNCIRRTNGTVDRESEIDGADIIAWMPLPKPYREDGEA